MLNEVRPALVIGVVLTLITGLAYPLAITGLAGLIFPHQAQGSLIEKDGKPIGSALIGQAFTSERYFHGRPSATTTSRPQRSDQDDAGALQRGELRRLQSRADQQGPDRAGPGRPRHSEKENPSAAVPIDLVTTSGSGLDPAHLARGGLVPGAARRQGAQPAGGQRCVSS